MPSKYLHAFYGFFTLSIAVAGFISILFSILWRKHDLLLNMTFSHADLTGAFRVPPSCISYSHPCLSSGGLVMGIALLLTSFLSIGAAIQRNHVTIGLVILNWVLIADAIIVITIGSFVWFYTLRERSEYHTQFAKLQPSQRITIQDQVTWTFLLLLHFSLTSSATMISSVVVDISMHRTSLKSAVAFARTRPLRMLSMPLFQPTSALHPLLNMLMTP